MSRLEELIQQHCPDGVEYMPLGKACLMERGTLIPRALITPNSQVTHWLFPSLRIPTACSGLKPLALFDN